MSNYLPLDDEEMLQLDGLLQSNEDYLLVDEAHGLITALSISASELLDGDGWLELILGGSVANVPEQTIELLNRLRDEVSESLVGSSVFEPLIAEFEEDGEILETYEGWCFGFMLAISEDDDSWAQLPQTEQDLLMPIAKLALLQEDEEVEIDDEEYESLVELIPGSVGGLYRYFRQ